MEFALGQRPAIAQPPLRQPHVGAAQPGAQHRLAHAFERQLPSSK
jgi:hypothetical protein